MVVLPPQAPSPAAPPRASASTPARAALQMPKRAALEMLFEILFTPLVWGLRPPLKAGNLSHPGCRRSPRPAYSLPMTSELDRAHAASGARILEDGRVLNFGDVPSEYRAGVEGAALFDTRARGRVGIRGDDAVGFLHRILANDVRPLAPGLGNRNLLLTPKGKVVQDFELQGTDDGLRAHTAPGQAPALIQALDLFLFADAVELTDESAATAPLSLAGPAAAELVAGLVPDVAGLTPGGWVQTEHAGAPLLVSRARVAGSEGFRLDAGPDGAAALWAALSAAGATPAGLVAFDSLRAEALAAEFGIDITDDVYPQEARLEHAFALDKGCYVGQEVVAKIDTYGGLNKRLMALRVDHDDPIPRGTKLLGHDAKRDTVRELGIATTWAYSFSLDGGLLLAYIKRRHQEPGTEFELEGGLGKARIVEEPLRTGAALG